jgi:hypothetical protein
LLHAFDIETGRSPSEMKNDRMLAAVRILLCDLARLDRRVWLERVHSLRLNARRIQRVFSDTVYLS